MGARPQFAFDFYPSQDSVWGQQGESKVLATGDRLSGAQPKELCQLPATPVSVCVLGLGTSQPLSHCEPSRKEGKN